MTAQLAGAATPASSHGSDGDTLLYVYGVTAKAQDFAELPRIEGLSPGHPVCFQICDDLVAVVSEVPKSDFSQEALKAKLQEPPWAQARVLDHHRVLMALSEVPLLPFKFCTVFADARSLRQALRRHATNLDTTLGKVAGAWEWGVKVFVDYEVLGRHLRSTDPHLVALTQKCRSAGPGTAFFLKRRLEQMARDAAAANAGRWTQTIHATIAGQARAAATQSPQPRSLHGRAADMLLNGAYLVPRTAELPFHRAIEHVASGYRDTGLEFEVIGPMPPYSFGTIDADDKAAGTDPRPR